MNDPILDALSLPAHLQDGLTVKEIADLKGRGKNWVLERLRELHAKGLLEVGQKVQPDMTGRPQRVPSYRLKPAT